MATHCVALLLLVISCSSLVSSTPCSEVSWVETFSHEGLSTCEVDHHAINGFYRTDATTPDKLINLEKVKCCQWDSVYSNDVTLVFQADWSHLFERDNQSARCPPGFFLDGLYRTGDSKSLLGSLDGGWCVKPASHQYNYGQCYDEDISESFNEGGYSSCRDGFFVTGLFRGPCWELHCLDKLRCCQMSTKPILMESFDSVKTRVMGDTLVDISYLAQYLGYGWTGSCRTGRVGQDFRRNGDTWEADKSGGCTGYRPEARLRIEYGDWNFGLKDIVYGDPVVESLRPEVIDSATIYNKDGVSSWHTVSRTEESVRTVTHTKTSSWETGSELGIQIGYDPPGGFAASVSYKFTYSNSQTTEDSESNEQRKTFSVESSKEIAPKSAAKWNLVLSKSRTTISYTAAVIVHFSAQLKGFMRYGGGYYGDNPNFHYQYRGSDSRPNFNYAFGSSSEPFYKTLKRENEENLRPWMWNDMQANYNYRPESVIDDLVDEDRYVFFLTGKFEDVVGNNVVITWEDVDMEDEESVTSTTDESQSSDSVGQRKRRDVGSGNSNSNSANKIRGSNSNNNNGDGGDTSRITGSSDGVTENIIFHRDEKNLVNVARILPEDLPPIFPPPPPLNITKKPKKEREPIALKSDN